MGTAILTLYTSDDEKSVNPSTINVMLIEAKDLLADSIATSHLHGPWMYHELVSLR